MRTLLYLLFTALILTSTATAQRSAAPSATGQRPDMGKMLMQGLKEVDGCLEVKTCKWNDGKSSIVAWFVDKAAAADWYYSDVHQGMIGNKTDGSLRDDEPMKYLVDEDQPIMVIATLTHSEKPELSGIDIPISQISIELFAPLPGGAQVGGRVSPAAFPVPHMRDYTSSDR